MNRVTLKKNEEAPDFTLVDQEGESFNLRSLQEKAFIYFYPRADTPGCTRQACSLQVEWRDLKSNEIEIIGISPDTPSAQKKFAQKYDLEFRLLADEDRSVAQAYGVWGEKTRNGKATMGIIRSAFLINERGTIVEAWYKISPDDTVPYLKRALELN